MTFIRPTAHVVKNTPTAKMFRRRLNCPDIFTFFSLETGQWILAYWIEKRVRMADEIEDLGPDFGLVTPKLVADIVVCWGNIDWKSRKKTRKQRLISKIRSQENLQNDKLSEQSDRYQWLQKRMKKPIPYAFASPVSGGEVVD